MEGKISKSEFCLPCPGECPELRGGTGAADVVARQDQDTALQGGAVQMPGLVLGRFKL